MTLKHKVNEALARAIPYLSERRREVVVECIMTRVLNEHLWYSPGESAVVSTASENVNIFSMVLMRCVCDKPFTPSVTMLSLENLNAVLNEYERRTQNQSP